MRYHTRPKALESPLRHLGSSCLDLHPDTRATCLALLSANLQTSGIWCSSVPPHVTWIFGLIAIRQLTLHAPTCVEEPC